MVYIIIHVAGRPLSAAGKLIGLSATDIGGMIAALANTIPAYGMMKDMTPLGKIINSAFISCAGFAFGDYLAFCTGVEPQLIPALLACKLSGGVIGTAIACFIFHFQKQTLRTEVIS